MTLDDIESQQCNPLTMPLQERELLPALFILQFNTCVTVSIHVERITASII